MMRWLGMVILCIGGSLTVSHADEESSKDRGITKILVTFADQQAKPGAGIIITAS